MDNFELLGKFYLGKELDPQGKGISSNLLLYDSKDLTTHAMIIGMTGSGKTGLGMALLEEALMDSIPVLAIDPKGDITNLLLSFPDQDPEDYLPWVNPDQAASEGLSPAEYASREASKWQKGLSGWGIDSRRISSMRNSVNFNIFTPGSDAGIRIDLLGSFSCPPENILNDRDLFLDKVQSTASNLLSLLNIGSDPISGREHLLLSRILENAWMEGRHVDLPMMITQVQDPPFKMTGVMPTDSFYPPEERFKLALAINQILASPSFSQWMTGVPLEMGNFLHTPEGKPRASIFTISHLSDTERMFFLSMFLNELTGWMRSQTGTPSLRAILYIDELFGYMPPVKEPPSKKPLLTLLKQARAFGIGVVLSTQNPVDLDYKGLANMGTWFIGRLQTQRDKDRVLEGMERLENTSGFDRQFLDKAITGLKKREFLLNNVHENSPSIFTTRWVMSYLRGPLTREQIRSLMKERKAPSSNSAERTERTSSKPGKGLSGPKPAIAPEIKEYFLGSATISGTFAYKPFILGMAETWYSNSTLGVQEKVEYSFATEAPGQNLKPEWENALMLNASPEDLQREGMGDMAFLDLPAVLAEPVNYKAWEKEFKTWIRLNRNLVIFRNPKLKLAGEPGETMGEFEIRVEEALREKRDLEVEKLRKKYDSRMATLQKQLLTAEHAIDRESEQARNRNMETVISFGSVIAGALLGRKSLTSTSTYRVGSALSKAGRLRKEKMDVERARERAELLRERITELEAAMNEEIEMLTENLEKYREGTREYPLRPKSTDITVTAFGLVWMPIETDH